jgi:hypothetical protein
MNIHRSTHSALKIPYPSISHTDKKRDDVEETTLNYTSRSSVSTTASHSSANWSNSK